MTAPDPGPVTVTSPGGAQEHDVCHDDQNDIQLTSPADGLKWLREAQSHLNAGLGFAAHHEAGRLHEDVDIVAALVGSLIAVGRCLDRVELVLT